MILLQMPAVLNMTILLLRLAMTGSEKMFVEVMDVNHTLKEKKLD